MKLVIVGGVAGGASAAARARRLSEDAQIVLFEKGPHISFANCGLPYHIGETITERGNIVLLPPEALKGRAGIDVRIRQEVIDIDRAAKKIRVRNAADGAEYDESYDKLILSPGSRPIRPPIPGVDDPDVLTLWTIPEMDEIKKRVDAGKRRAVVVGGGFIGLEIAENLIARGVETSLVELLPQVLPPLDPEMVRPLEETLARHGVALHLKSGVTRIDRADGALKILLQDGSVLTADFVVMAAGVRPNVELAKGAGLAIGAAGGIAVDEHMRTSDPDIFAVGDAIQVKDLVLGTPAMIPLAGPANKQGRIAADNAFGASESYKGTIGTSIVKVFELAAASAGPSEKKLRQAGIAYEKLYLHPFSHASYYPGAGMMCMKILFAPDGRLLGAQVVGVDGVDKRVDVLATAIRAGMKVGDLEELELAYAPPYSSAKDPVNFVGFAASNILKGDTKVAHADAIPDGALLLDVRQPEEVACGTIPGAIAIPLGKLRGRLGELPRDKEIVAFCRVGIRGYLAERILRQKGFNVRNLSGGYLTWKLFHPDPLPHAGQPPAPPKPCGTTGKKELENLPTTTLKELDARGLQCPGPIVQVKRQLDAMAPNEQLRVKASDRGFLKDLPSWCASTGNTLVEIKETGGEIEAIVRKTAKEGASQATPTQGGNQMTNKKTTIVLFSNDLDKSLAAMIMATGFASLGHEVSIFFTFWGLNVLRRDNPPPVKKGLLDAMFGMMMPRGAKKLALSKMHFAGMGTAMMKHVMASKNVNSLPEMIAQARSMGVKFLACEMAMNVMGITAPELIDGVESAGVANFAALSEQSGTTLFI